LSDVENPTFSTQSTHRWGRCCQPYAPAALYPKEDSVYSFLLEAEPNPRAIVRLDGLCKLKYSINSSDIEPANFLHHRHFRVKVENLGLESGILKIQGSFNHNFCFLAKLTFIYLHTCISMRRGPWRNCTEQFLVLTFT
jgi:hypothetical protein